LKDSNDDAGAIRIGDDSKSGNPLQSLVLSAIILSAIGLFPWGLYFLATNVELLKYDFSWAENNSLLLIAVALVLGIFLVVRLYLNRLSRRNQGTQDPQNEGRTRVSTYVALIFLLLALLNLAGCAAFWGAMKNIH